MNSDSNKIYREEEKKLKTENSILVLNAVREKIKKFYIGDLDFDYLIKRYQELEYVQKHRNGFTSTVLLGLLSGTTATAYYEMIKSRNTLALILATVTVLILVLLSIKWLEPAFFKLSTRPYVLFIVPFEKQIIIKKLKKDFNFSIDYNEKGKTTSRKNPYRPKFKKPHLSVTRRSSSSYI